MRESIVFLVSVACRRKKFTFAISYPDELLVLIFCNVVIVTMDFCLK